MFTTHKIFFKNIWTAGVNATWEKEIFRWALCGKPYFNNSNLTRHMCIHTCERPFSCFICNRLLKQSNDLKCHMCSHTGEKQFSCSSCNKSFIYSSSLKRHHTCIRNHNLRNLDGWARINILTVDVSLILEPAFIVKLNYLFLFM